MLATLDYGQRNEHGHTTGRMGRALNWNTPWDKTPPWRHFERNSGSCRHSQVSYLVLTVEDVDAVLIPAEDPAVSEETAQQPELSICWTISSDWTRTRKHLKLRDLTEKKCPSVCHQRHTDRESSSQLAGTPLNTCGGVPFSWPGRGNTWGAFVAQEVLIVIGGYCNWRFLSLCTAGTKNHLKTIRTQTGTV